VSLADQIQQAALAAVLRTAPRQRLGAVAAVSPLTVTLGGDTAAVPATSLDSYPPVAGDTVTVLVSPGSSPLVLGKAYSAALPDLQTGTASVGPTSGTTELVLATSTALTLDGRTRVRVEFESARIDTTVGTDVFTFNIKDGATVVRARRYPAPAIADAGFRYGWISAAAPSAGSHTYTATVVRSAGTGTLTINGSATNLLQLSVTEFR
jgi:hypothetical protein